MKKEINLFIRQPFTETYAAEKSVIASAFSVIKQLEGKEYCFNYLTGSEALSNDNFQLEWEKTMQQPFSPQHFRDYRIKLLARANAFINIRTALSESSAFEMAYNAYITKIPLFFAIWNQAPLKTTLLKEMDALCRTEYCYFDKAEELRLPLDQFFASL